MADFWMDDVFRGGGDFTYQERQNNSGHVRLCRQQIFFLTFYTATTKTPVKFTAHYVVTCNWHRY